MFKPLRCALLLIASLTLSVPAWASQAGWRQITVPGSGAEPAPITVALYYPTQATAGPIPMGPFTVRAAMRAEPEANFKGLIILSHGMGGSELGHSSLAEALAQNGYLVAALRHPGDNWQDRSLLTTPRYFTERPRQVSQVIDALLNDPAWQSRIASDARGPRIGALGHSAGGYTVMALAGAQPEIARIARHCATERASDPIFCSVDAGVRQAAAPAATMATAPTAVTSSASSPDFAVSPVSSVAIDLRDPRVRAVVAMAPAGVLFTPESLGRLRIPAAVYEAEQDRFLVPRFHAEWIARNAPQLELHRIPNALHFAFMDTPSMAIPTEDGDVRADLPGFERAAFLQRLGQELPAFFDKALQ